MKTRTYGLIVVALLAPLFVVGTVFAVDTQTSQPTENTTTEKESKKQTLDEKQKKELSERVQKRKAEAKTKLNTVQDKRLKTRCKNAQGLIRNTHGKVKGVETNRFKIHNNLVDRLKKLQTKLIDKGIDTAALQANITELEARIATFNTDLAAYRQTVEDLGNIEDCTADTDAFKASLEAARTALQKVRGDAVAIRTYVKETVKPTLKDIRAQIIEAKKTTNGSEGGQ